MKRSIFFISFIMLIIVSLSIVQISLSNSLATKGVVLGQVDEQIKYYKRENSLLEEKMLNLTSYSHIASAAADLGFVSDKKITYIKNSMPVALEQ